MLRRVVVSALLVSTVFVTFSFGVAGSEVVDGEIDLVQTLSAAPDRPGEIEVELRFAIPENVVSLTTEVPDGATVTRTNGFDPASGAEYEWRGTTREPSITYAVRANQTVDRAGPIAEDGQYLFVATGEWALVSRPRTATRWSWSGPGVVRLNRTFATAAPGASGERIAYLGPHEVETWTAGGQTFALVVPDASTLEESPDDIASALSEGSETLRVGARESRVFLVAAPSDVDWAVRGLQTGKADVWVSADQPFDEPDSVWLHEYVHTRQQFDASEEVGWFYEASAVYYAASIALEADTITFDEFRARLASGEESPHHDDVLADPSTWDDAPAYHKGALVAGELDRRIRLATDGERSLQDVFREMNEHEGRVTRDDFLRFVEEAGGEGARESAARYTETRAAPSMWSRAEHEEAFGRLPARIGYRLSDEPDAHRVTGPYRNRSIELVDGRTVVLVEGERLLISTAVENAGGTAGTYDARLRIDGERVVKRTGRIEPGETRTVTFAHPFDRTGRYAVDVGDDRLKVRVVGPAAELTDLRVDRTEVDPGEPVGVEATVANEASVPARADLRLRVDGETREERSVALDAGETRTVTFAVRLEQGGEHTVALGGREVSILVVERNDPTLEQPGFGAGVATGAIAAAALARLALTARRRSPGRR